MKTTVARTPQKLTDLLSKRGIKEDITQSKLVIIQGNAKDQEAVSKVLVDESGKVADKIIFGIGTHSSHFPSRPYSKLIQPLTPTPGGTPKLTPNPLKPTLDDPVVCQSSMSTILSSVRAIFTSPSYHGQARPLVTAISTTGMSAKRDIPLLMIPLYHWLLAVPHADKKVMEEEVEKAKAEGVIREYVIVKPSLLMGENRLGRENIRVGWEGKEVFEPGDWVYD